MTKPEPTEQQQEMAQQAIGQLRQHLDWDGEWDTEREAEDLIAAAIAEAVAQEREACKSIINDVWEADGGWYEALSRIDARGRS